MIDEPIRGGCFCGAIRYESTQPPIRTGMCHCRMCQRWTGAPAATSVFFDVEGFEFTEGQPRRFMTSQILERHYCGDCGTALGHRYQFGDDANIEIVLVGTLDKPGEVSGPQFYFGVESHLEKWIALDEGVRQIRADDYRPLARAWEEAGDSG